MKAKAAKNKADPKEPKGPRARSDEGRFVGVRVNEDEVPRLPIFPDQWALDDPRQRPYLVVWGAHERVSVKRATSSPRRANNMDGLVQIQAVVQGNAGAVGLVALDAQGRVWYGELSGAKAPARYSVKWTRIEERP
jgi:hypothetical protein